MWLRGKHLNEKRGVYMKLGHFGDVRNEVAIPWGKCSLWYFFIVGGGGYTTMSNKIGF